MSDGTVLEGSVQESAPADSGTALQGGVSMSDGIDSGFSDDPPDGICIPCMINNALNALAAAFDNSPSDAAPKPKKSPPAGGASKSGAPAAPSSPFTAEFQKAWKDSFNKDGTVTEQGGSIIKKKDGTVEVRRAAAGASGSIPLSNYPKPGPGETLVGTFHTHPYSKAEGGYTGVSFSGSDIRNFLKEDQGNTKYIMAGDKVFELTKDDPALAAKADPDAVKKTWDDTYAASKDPLPTAADNATKAAIKGTGLGYKTMKP
jgi:hypothetical protein